MVRFRKLRANLLSFLWPLEGEEITLMSDVKLASIKISAYTIKDVFRRDKKFKHIITVNSQIAVLANENERLKKIINNGVATIDGQVPLILAKLINKKIDIQKISGSDFIYDACDFAKKNNSKMFLLGGSQISNKLSVQKIKDKYGISVDGFSPDHLPYPFPQKLNTIILDRIRQIKPEFLFVGFGCPKQEYWIDDNKDELVKIGVRWAVGCGGTFEFVSGNIRRSPKWVQRLCLESLYRFLQEPKIFRVRRIFYSMKIFKYIFNTK